MSTTIRFRGTTRDKLEPISDVVPHPQNANNGDVDEIAESILLNGVYRSVYVSTRTKHIVAGHHLHEALQSLGSKTAPVEWIDDLTDEDELRILAADNKTARLAKMDPTSEKHLLDALAETSRGLAGTGYSTFYHDKLNEELEEAIKEDLDFDPSPEEHLTHEIICPHCGAAFTRGANR